MNDGHNAELAVFLHKAWGQKSSADDVASWRARDASTNPVAPNREPPKWVFTRGDEVIGYLGTIPTRFAIGDVDIEGHWLKGFWVLPEYRGGPVGAAVLRQAMADLGPAGSTVVAEPARRLMEAEGMVDLGRFFNRLKVLRPGRLLSRLDVGGLNLDGLPKPVVLGVTLLQRTRTTGLAGLAVTSATSIAANLRGRPPGRLRVTRGWSQVSPADLDGAWSGFRAKVRAAAVRDGAMLAWRYAHNPRYDIVGVWSEGALRAWSVLRTPTVDADGRLKGIAIASLSDILFPPDAPELGLAAVAGAERVASEMGADAVLCSGTHAALDEVLSRRGFISVPRNLHILVRDRPEGATRIPLGEWWLTRGDGAADESF